MISVFLQNHQFIYLTQIFSPQYKLGLDLILDVGFGTDLDW